MLVKASLFITCVSDLIFPDVGKSVVGLLRHYGCEVDFPADQTCCGQPAYNSGYHKEAKEAAIQMIKVFKNSEYVVTPSGSCASMIRHYYPYLFAEDNQYRDQANDLVNKTYEISEFLVKVLGVEKVEGSLAGTAVYHHSCHMMRGLGISDEPIKLLSSIQNLKLAPLPYEKDCCGFGGTFAVKMSDISEHMVDEKAEHIISTGANILISSDMACLMNIDGRLKRLGHHLKVYHTAQLLWEGVKNHDTALQA
jgi:L-lactate dehydrogenase complex protein LldE